MKHKLILTVIALWMAASPVAGQEAGPPPPQVQAERQEPEKEPEKQPTEERGTGSAARCSQARQQEESE